MAILNGRDYTQALLVGQSGRGYNQVPVGETQALFPDLFITDLLAESEQMLDVTMTSTTTLTIGIAAHVVTPTKMRSTAIAGLYGYLIHDVSNLMFGQITAVTATTFTLTVASLDDVVGSGAHSSWTFHVSGPQGSQGVTGPSGASVNPITFFLS